MVDRARTEEDLISAVFDTRGTSHITPQDMRDFILSVYPNAILASAYLAEEANTNTGRTTALQNAWDAMRVSDNAPGVIVDVGGFIDINDEIVLDGDDIENRFIRGLNMFQTAIRQNTNNKGGLIMAGTVSGVDRAVARSRITDLRIVHASQQDDTDTDAFGIGYTNTVDASNAFLGFDLDRLYIEGFCYGIGIRSAAGVFITLWGTNVGKTWLEIHNSARTALKWSSDFVGQPENVGGNIYIQDDGIATGTYPAVILENVEAALHSLGIEDHDDKLVELYGDECVAVDLLHVERCDFSGGQSLIWQGHNSLSVKQARVYQIGGSGNGNLFNVAGSAGYLDVGSITSRNVTNASGDLALVATGGRGWRIGNYKPIIDADPNDNQFLPYRSSDTDARNTCIEYNGKYIGKVLPATISGNGQTVTPTARVVILTVTGGARTGGILAVGSIEGEEVVIRNTSANSWTFAADATSNVQGGTGVSIAANTLKRFSWDSASSRWYPS